MKRAIVVLVLASMGTIGVGTANAASRYETTISHTSSVDLAGNWFLDSGRIYSLKQDCERHRHVTVLAQFEDGTVVRQDADKSSFNGVWATRERTTLVVRFKAKVRRAVLVNRHHHRTICKAASIAWPAP
jgi:hypothetical protein